MVSNGAIVEEFALMVTQSHRRARVTDHLQRAGLTAARCHVHSSVHRPTGSRVAATCTSNGDACLLPLPPACMLCARSASDLTCGARGQEESARREISLISGRQWWTDVYEDSVVLGEARMGTGVPLSMATVYSQPRLRTVRCACSYLRRFTTP